MVQGSNTIEEDAAETMNIKEVARAIEWLRANDLSDTDIINCLTYIATGINKTN